jgi:hypothetical protein
MDLAASARRCSCAVAGLWPEGLAETVSIRTGAGDSASDGTLRGATGAAVARECTRTASSDASARMSGFEMVQLTTPAWRLRVQRSAACPKAWSARSRIATGRNASRSHHIVATNNVFRAARLDSTRWSSSAPLRRCPETPPREASAETTHTTGLAVAFDQGSVRSSHDAAVSAAKALQSQLLDAHGLIEAFPLTNSLPPLTPAVSPATHRKRSGSARTVRCTASRASRWSSPCCRVRRGRALP